MRILRHDLILHFAIVIMVGCLPLLLMWESGYPILIQAARLSAPEDGRWARVHHDGQSFPGVSYFSARPASVHYDAAIISGSNTLTHLPQVVRVRNTDPTILNNLVEQHLVPRRWDASDSKSLHLLPLHSLFIVFCQLRR